MPEVAPVLNVFNIVDRRDGTTSWIRCGRAKVNRDGSINLELDVLPLNGRLHMRAAVDDHSTAPIDLLPPLPPPPRPNEPEKEAANG